jgi:hypothetical protein
MKEDFPRRNNKSLLQSLNFESIKCLAQQEQNETKRSWDNFNWKL